MKYLLFSLIFSVWISKSYSQSPVGTWLAIDEETNQPKAHVAIYEHEGKLYGKIVKLLVKTPKETCDFCKGINKDKPYIGMLVIYNMVKKNDEWQGRVYKVSLGTEFKGSLKMIGKDKIKVTGSYLLISRSQIWTRVS